MLAKAESKRREQQMTQLDGITNSMDMNFSKLREIVAEEPAAAAKSLQLCPTPWDPIDGSPPGSPIPGILQAGSLEWIAISFSNA